MRIDREVIAFAGVVDGGTIADVNFQGADAIAVLVDITAHAGTATLTDVELVPRDGAIVFPATGSAKGDVIGIPQLVNETIGVAMTRIGPAGTSKAQYVGNGFWIPTPFNEGRIRAELTGAGHTITGNVYVFRRFA